MRGRFSAHPLLQSEPIIVGGWNYTWTFGRRGLLGPPRRFLKFCSSADIEGNPCFAGVAPKSRKYPHFSASEPFFKNRLGGPKSIHQGVVHAKFQGSTTSSLGCRWGWVRKIDLSFSNRKTPVEVSRSITKIYSNCGAQIGCVTLLLWIKWRKNAFLELFKALFMICTEFIWSFLPEARISCAPSCYIHKRM